MTAEQYLAWVHFEASKLPDVFRAEVDESLYHGKQTKYMPEVEDVADCPEFLLPSQDWEREVVAAFSDLRALLARLSLSEASRERKQVVPQLKDGAAWERFCLLAEIRRVSRDREIVDRERRASMEIAENRIDRDVLERKAKLAEEMGITMGTSDAFASTSASVGACAGSGVGDENGENNDDEAKGDSDGDKPATVYPEWTGTTNADPTTSLLLQFDQVMTQRLLGYQVGWLEDR
jgi:hypothetical protein